ncbi:limonene-1,2-epoxide hydrolase [Luteibacter sp. UNCMF331Sha3.1]|uniref:limonene-1,2-epoxide hydrolase family protein n=1 Tax=Luteibacter sp. UNCMF331Sha3.1 TaxID=1502760 RepID=UPI0008D2B6F2|nr:limonene-1,2-epoxide hydrolase family protein [Luteibacter sp. UNCMF331Sha3.1]SEN12877.1 limonene-1,2-epoxide hydrolase [Luteibacter sp. UNCMF331Sha3.1]
MARIADRSPLEVATIFFDHWNQGRIDEALAMLSEDVLYDNVPLPDITGREGVEAFHRGFGVGRSFTVEWRVVNIAAAGDVVLNERLDIFRHVSGPEIVLPVMGTLTVVDGLITIWRDYFDLATFEKQASSMPA